MSVRTFTIQIAAVLMSCAPGMATAQDQGRQYASQCFGCHGTNGNSVAEIDSLTGKSAKEIVEELTEMRKKASASNIMHKHALTWTDQQIRDLAAYLATVNHGN